MVSTESQVITRLNSFGARKDPLVVHQHNEIKQLTHTMSRAVMRNPSDAVLTQLFALHQMIKTEFAQTMSDEGIEWLLGASMNSRGTFKNASSFKAFFDKDPMMLSSSRLITAIESVLLLLSYRAINEWRAAPPAKPEVDHPAFLMWEKIHKLFDGKIVPFIGDVAYLIRVNEIGEYYEADALRGNTVEALADEISDVSDAENEAEKKPKARLSRQTYLKKLNPQSDAESWPGAASDGNIPIRSHVSGSTSIVLSVINELYKQNKDETISQWFSDDNNVRTLAGALLIPTYERGDFHSAAETAAAIEYYLEQRAGKKCTTQSPKQCLSLGLKYMADAAIPELKKIFLTVTATHILPKTKEVPVLLSPTFNDYVCIVKETNNKKLAKDIVDRVIKQISASTSETEQKNIQLTLLLKATQASSAFKGLEHTVFGPNLAYQDALNCILEAQKNLSQEMNLAPQA